MILFDVEGAGSPVPFLYINLIQIIMAIYFNEKILEPKADGSSLQRRYYREKKEVEALFEKFRKNGAPSVLMFRRDFVKKYNTKKTSYKPAPPVAVPANVHVYDDELGAVEIRYSKTPPIKSGKKLVWTADKDFMLSEVFTINEKNIDLAWFFLKASNYVTKGIVKLVDKDLEFKGSFSEVKRQMEASRILFDDDVTMERIETLAELVLPKEMKIEADTKEEYATKLWDIIVAGEKSRKEYNYDALMEANKKISKAQAADYVDKTKKQLILIVLADGREVTVPEVKCPPKTKEETLEERAAAHGFPTEGLTRDEIYSLIKYKDIKDE